jgi:iron complex outermembrane recepter protein
MKSSIVKSAIALLVLLFGASIASGQTKQLLTYRDSLDIIRKLTGGELEEQKDSVVRIRTGIEFWLRLHPDTTIKLEAAPQQPWKSEQLLNEAKLLRDAVEAIIKEDHGQSFNLGVTEISITVEASPLSPVTDSIDHVEISDLHIANVAQAAQYLPGVALDRKSGRNQTGIMIRGFDTRQVGLYLDGVPIYVPYDGYADVSRSLASDIALIEVAKGYSSPLLGPNGLGGTVNLVTRQPDKKLEGDAIIGAGSGSMLESGMHVGSRLNNKLFIRGGMDWLQTDYFPLSGNFATNSYQPTHNRINSDQADVRYTGRIGWTPRGEDQYVFTYVKQKSDNNVPPYSGNDIANNTPKYWRFAYWNRDSYYFNSNTGLGEHNSIKVRAFYDKYPNGLSTFPNAAHTNMTDFTPYDDYSGGFSSEFSSRMIPRNALGASFFLKDDTHKEQKFSYANGVTTAITPWIMDRDRLLSLGFQDVLNPFPGLRATVGISIDYLNEITAQQLDQTNTVVPYQCTIGTVTAPCVLASKWAFNPLVSLSYSVANSGTVFFTFAQKSHFPTLKDRYSSKFNKAIPNPGLLPEHARNYTLGYSHAFASNTMMQIELFRSDVYDAIENANVPAQYLNQCKSTGPSICQQSVNIGDEMHQGIEFSIRSSPVRRLKLTANYTYLLRTLTGPDNSSHPTLPQMQLAFPQGTPKNKAGATATVSLPHELLLIASVRYEGGAFTVTTDKNDITKFWIMPASKFGTMDLGTIIPGYAGASFQIGVKNLFDRNYYYQEGFPEAGRTWYLNMRYRF